MGRRRSTRCTTAHGHRSDLLRGRGQASSRSLGRSGATAPCGAPRGTASRPLACRSWLGRRERQLTPPPSPSSRPLRWRPAKRKEEEVEEGSEGGGQEEEEAGCSRCCIGGVPHAAAAAAATGARDPETQRRLDELHQLLVSVSMHDKFQQFLPFLRLWPHSSSTFAVARAWLVLLVTLHPALDVPLRLGPVHRRRARFYPRHQGGEGVAGSRGV